MVVPFWCAARSNSESLASAIVSQKFLPILCSAKACEMTQVILQHTVFSMPRGVGMSLERLLWLKQIDRR